MKANHSVKAAKLVNDRPVCKACEGTGRNSKGDRCFPCQLNNPTQPLLFQKTIFDK